MGSPLLLLSDSEDSLLFLSSSCLVDSRTNLGDRITELLKLQSLVSLGRLLIGFCHVDAREGYFEVVTEANKAWVPHLSSLIAKLLEVTLLIQVLFRVKHENFK